MKQSAGWEDARAERLRKYDSASQCGHLLAYSRRNVHVLRKKFYAAMIFIAEMEWFGCAWLA
jgi:hypothetical protein